MCPLNAVIRQSNMYIDSSFGKLVAVEFPQNRLVGNNKMEKNLN